MPCWGIEPLVPSLSIRGRLTTELHWPGKCYDFLGFYFLTYSHCEYLSLWSCPPPWLKVPPICLMAFNCMPVVLIFLLSFYMFWLQWKKKRMKGRNCYLKQFPFWEIPSTFMSPELVLLVVPSSSANLWFLAWLPRLTLYGSQRHWSFTLFAL